MMSEKVEYLLAKSRNLVWASFRKIIGDKYYSRNSYNSKIIEGPAYANKTISNSILHVNQPFLAARFGANELRTVIYALEIKLGIRKCFPEYICKKMKVESGFFSPSQENMMKFGEIMIESCRQVDLFGVWFNILEDYVIKKYAPNSKLTQLESLEPYLYNEPWSSALKGKKVLVIHPFVDTIKHQYLKRLKLFENKNILPDFELITLKAIQTIAGGEGQYRDWFEALDTMYQSAKAIDFDVAIVGCGAYGMPLAAKLKLLNKKVIHLAGATQLLFGIRGARWDARPEMQYLFNEYWVRPSLAEKPKLANDVEGGCYW